MVSQQSQRRSMFEPEEKARLKELQKQRDDLTDQIAESLEYRLGKDGAAKVKPFMKDQMKRKIKIME